MKRNDLEFEEIRRIALSGIASQDELCERLVFKGGNALEIIHKIGNRSSLDLDFSIDGDIQDIGMFETQLTRGIQDRFDAHGYVVFDTKFEFKPQLKTGTVPEWWGGYTFNFKIISREKYRRLHSDVDALRRNSLNIDKQNHRNFEIQISRAEYCVGSEKKDIDGFPLKVYTTSMIACEKLRAICQQMPEYEISPGESRSARARDFYDIFILVDGGYVDFSDPSTIEILKAMFEAKNVQIELLCNIERDSEHHERDWPKLQNAVRGTLKEFDFYVRYVVQIVERLKSLGVVNSPC